MEAVAVTAEARFLPIMDDLQHLEYIAEFSKTAFSSHLVVYRLFVVSNVCRMAAGFTVARF